MHMWVFTFLFTFHFNQYLSFKIEIYQCSTPNGYKGFCRQQEHCVGYRDSLTSHGCPQGTVCCPKRNVSKRKCYEYADAVFGNSEGAMTLMAHSNDATRTDECAIKAVPLIIGGERVDLKEFPHMAAIGFGDSPFNARWECGGSLISEQYVLTAAHCLDKSDRRPRFVKLGVVNVITDNRKNLQMFEIEKIIIHPRFMKKDKTNDIALLKLSKKVKFTPFVRPTCLDYTGTFTETKAIATGWGVTNVGDLNGSPDLLKVQLDIVGRPDCTKAFKYKLRTGLEDSMLCAGVLAGGKDTCQGDSGGPLQTIRSEPYCMYKLIGVTSFGNQCAYQWSPAIYSRTFIFVPWIESIVWPNEH